jgi:hypothetical protein
LTRPGNPLLDHSSTEIGINDTALGARDGIN